MFSVRRAVVAAAVVSCLAPAAADAAPPRSAQRFADAVERGASAVRATKGAVEAHSRAVELQRCVLALVAQPPRRAEDRVVALFTLAFVDVLSPTVPAMQRIVADLDQIPTNDPALRAGREAWRRSVALFAAAPKVDRPCHAVERWAEAGFPAASAPPVDLAALKPILDEEAGEAIERDLARAAKRLRRLGIPRGYADRFADFAVMDEVTQDTGVLEDALFDPRG